MKIIRFGIESAGNAACGRSARPRSVITIRPRHQEGLWVAPEFSQGLGRRIKNSAFPAATH
jgi:hypothetical protein